MIEQLRKELNKPQLDAVTTIDGPLLIIAGAGSGKTRVITYRMAYMLEKGIHQSAILALTFTNKAAREMSQRIRELTGKKLQSLTVSTFHAFGAKLLRDHIELLGWRDRFSIYDQNDFHQLIKETGKEFGFTRDSLDVWKVAELFSAIKTGRATWEHANDAYRQLYDEVQHSLKVYNAVDFDDLLGLPIRLLEEHPALREELRARYRYFLVDEFQDTSAHQYRFLSLLASENICVVGDDDQSIYSWRGANYENIRRFEREHPGLKEIKLEQNYRSTGTILDAANGLISHNTDRKDKALWSGGSQGYPIVLCSPENEMEEAEYVAEKIKEHAIKDGVKYDQVGILVRTNALTRHIEEALLGADMPYRMSGGTSFFERKEIRDLISYLRVVANPEDDMSLLRIINTPRRGIGKKTIEVLGGLAKERDCSLWNAMVMHVHAADSPLPEKMKEELGEFVNLVEHFREQILGKKGLAAKCKQLIEHIDYWSYLVSESPDNEKVAKWKFLNINYLIDSIERWEKDPDNLDPSLYKWLHRVSLVMRDDIGDDEEGGKVNLMTIHAAKGLEWDLVFILGAEDGIIPHARSVEEGAGNVEEERRLFYVAITRARERLYITSCLKRRSLNSLRDCVPSPFLEEIPPHLVERAEVASLVTEDDKITDYFAKIKKKLKF